MASTILKWMDRSDDEDPGTTDQEVHVADQEQSCVELNDRDALAIKTNHGSTAVADCDHDENP